MTLVEAVTRRLRAAGCVFAEDEAALLLSAAEPGELDALVTRRVAGEPLETVLGWVDFAGLRLAVGPGVFVPRQRTALLARCAVSAAGSVVVDLCCGVGAVGAAVLTAAPDTTLYAVDVDPVAVAFATDNLSPWRDAHALVGDLFAPLPQSLRGRVDVVAANAPYVPTGRIALMPPEARDHEPLTALDGGDDGVSFHRRIAAAAREWLSPDGTLLIETGRSQAELTVAALAAVGFSTRVVTDDEIDGTVVIGSLRSTQFRDELRSDEAS